MSRMVRRASTALAIMALLVPVVGHADALAIDFEAYSLGNIHGQDGWSAFGSAGSGCAVYDVAVVDQTPYAVPGFGDQSLRISNAKTSGCFGDQTFSKSLVDEAGEADADANGYSGGERRSHFEASWEFASTVPGEQQPGLSVVASPDRGDGARMSWVQMTDEPDGLAVNFYDFQTPDVDADCANGDFFLTSVASGLDRTVPHSIAITMDLLDGFSNDIVRVYVDGELKHTGTSWEDYFRECQLVGGEQVSRTVDSILFRVGGIAAPATLGNGFLIDNVSTSSSLIPTAMSAEPAIASLDPLAVNLFTLKANLGYPVAGKTITFSVGADAVCTGVTDANGDASCDALLSAAQITLNLGYTASFGGDAQFIASSASAGLIA